MVNQTTNPSAQKIADHLAEFWLEIGKMAGILDRNNGYNAVFAKGYSWPSKIFDLQPSALALELLKSGIEIEQLPNAILAQSEATKVLLESSGFERVSSLKAMALDVSEGHLQVLDEHQFETVTTKGQAGKFARIAAGSFDYPVKSKTVEALLNNPKFHMFLGKHEGALGSCGMLYLDNNDVCGFHMIGTLPTFRGKGLGKSMTQYLLNKTVELGYGTVYLVASKSGEPIYSKLGFATFGEVETFALTNTSR